MLDLDLKSVALMDVLNQLQFSLSITGPICLMLLLGIVFKRIGLINDNFIDVGSKLVFKVTLPTMLFLSIVVSDHDVYAASSFIIFSVVASVVFFLFSSLATHSLFSSSADKGVIIQGSFRANTGIIGIAYVANAFGEQGVALGAIYVAAITLTYNILAVICLTPKGSESGETVGKMMISTLTKNPLILAILLGILVYILAIPIPDIAIDAGNYLAKMTLPLALLCTGGSLNLGSLKREQAPSWFASSNKLVIAPVTITACAYWLGFRDLELGVIFFMNAAPVAAASYVMARSMGGNSTLAANIIALTTVISTLTCTAGVLVLLSLGLING